MNKRKQWEENYKPIIKKWLIMAQIVCFILGILLAIVIAKSAQADTYAKSMAVFFIITAWCNFIERILDMKEKQ